MDEQRAAVKRLQDEISGERPLAPCYRELHDAIATVLAALNTADAEMERLNGLFAQAAREIGELTSRASTAEVVAAHQRYRAEEAERKFHGACQDLCEVDQIAGKALGYAEAYPEVSEIDDGSVCTGEHTPVTVVMELARCYQIEREKVRRLREALDLALTGGNHLGSALMSNRVLCSPDFTEPKNHEEAYRLLWNRPAEAGDTLYEMWCAWRACMDAARKVDALDEVEASSDGAVQ